MKRIALPASGFTLIEVVIATLLLAILTSSIIGLNGGLFNRTSDIQKVQQASLMVQACADLVIGIRKNTDPNIFFSTPSTAIGTSCSNLPSLNTNITLSIASAVTTASPCPTGMTCVQSDINAKTGATASTPLVTLFFVKY